MGRTRKSTRRRESDFQGILGALPKLSQNERQQIRAACSQLGVAESVSHREEGEDEYFVLFYSVLTSTLRDAIGGRSPPRVGVLPPQVQRIVREGWSAVESLLEQVDPKPSQRTRLRFYHLVVTATIDYVSDLEHVPVALKTVSAQLSNCGAIMNSQFPGYVRAGLLRLILDWGRPGAVVDSKDL